MTQSLKTVRSRPLESSLLVLTIGFGAALSGLVLSAAWPGLTRDLGGSGISGHELRVQINDTDIGLDQPGAPVAVRVGLPGDGAVVMDEADLAKLGVQAPDVQVAYLAESVNIGDRSRGLDVSMVTSDYFNALKVELMVGSLPGAADYKAQRPVVVLTEYAARTLFPGQSAVGQELQNFKVVGVLRVPEGDQNLFRSADQTQFGALGLVPYGSTGIQQSGMNILQPPLSTLRFLPLPGRDAQAAEQLGRAARARWSERVSVSSNLVQRAAVGRAARLSALSLALLGVGGLLIASLSILALMLGRVSSRTRQLGMAAALGASRARLRGQYLGEVVLLGGVGSALGGLAAAGLVWWMGRGVSGPYAGWLTLEPLVLGGVMLGSLLLSVLFGLVPAIQASRVRPAEALRA
ncbi:FtsX-like permease family protein [Deinococcus sp.]|uniref:ABC transporter permease n=1 Tax=Deinococcus sp. TaxID=47478 RepID=UPI0025EC1F3E|nr:FtsX-like permease family protein [Deinococcus sp.]